MGSDARSAGLLPALHRGLLRMRALCSRLERRQWSAWHKRCAVVAAVLACLLIVETAQVTGLARGVRYRLQMSLLQETGSEGSSGEAPASVAMNYSNFETTEGKIHCVRLRAGIANQLSNSSECWEPPGPTLEFSLESAEQISPQNVPLKPRVLCHGIRDYTRTCLFHDLLWDLEMERWVFFGGDEGPAGALGDVPKPGEPWIRLDRTFTNRYESVTRGAQGLLVPGERHMHVDWRPVSQAPPVDTLITSPLEAVHLRVMLNPASIGHFLRDNLLPLVSVPLSFGEDPREFVWLQADSNMTYAERFRAASPLLEHYSSWFPRTRGPAAHMLWASFVRQAQEAVQMRMGSVSGGAEAGAAVRYIRFPKLLAGRGGADHAGMVGELDDTPTYQDVIAWSHACRPQPWRAMREIAYQNVGLVHKPAKDLQPSILFIDGNADELRTFPNITELLPGIQEEFPGAEIRYEQISALSGEEQLELLANTTVLVSSIGSRSFRMAYLPDGAQVVLVGPPEYYGKHPDDLHSFEMPFREVEWCWGSLGYVNVLLYHLDEPEDVAAGTFVLGNYSMARRKYNPMLRTEKLLPLLRRALENVDVFGGGQW